MEPQSSFPETTVTSTLATLGTGCGAYALSSSRGVSTHDPCTMKTISSNNQKVS